MPFNFTETEIPDVVLIEPIVFSDDRGQFLETYKLSAFRDNGINHFFVQDSQSISKKGVVRGLHFQSPPKAQGKLVSVVVGSMFDVAVDIRKGSPTYSDCVGKILSGDNRLMMWIPPGFAHGFMALSENLIMNYKFTNPYSPEHEGGIVWNDSNIGIDWPDEQPLLSSRDLNLPTLEEIETPFTYANPGD